jgi:hypothetical protein
MGWGSWVGLPAFNDAAQLTLQVPGRLDQPAQGGFAVAHFATFTPWASAIRRSMSSECRSTESRLDGVLIALPLSDCAAVAQHQQERPEDAGH